MRGQTDLNFVTGGDLYVAQNDNAKRLATFLKACRQVGVLSLAANMQLSLRSIIRDWDVLVLMPMNVIVQAL
jgi:hypothetical protein